MYLEAPSPFYLFPAHSIPETDYFEVEVENGRIMLTPVRMQQADAVRTKLEALGINDQDVLDAIQWARKSQP